MSSEAAGLRVCPFCKEEIKADAIKCKHCKSRLAQDRPTHGGTCPFCKEEIKADAIKCKHCGSMVGGAAESPCCDGCAEASTPWLAPSPAGLAPGFYAGDPTQAPPGAAAAAPARCSECTPVVVGKSRFHARWCCKKTYVPFLGFVDVCWPEPCFGIPEGPILA